MIIVAGTIDLDPADIDRARQAGRDMIAATREETGCIEYAFAEDITEPGRIRVFEIWTDEDALAAHGETPHMATWRSTLSSLRVRGRAIKVYGIDGERDL